MFLILAASFISASTPTPNRTEAICKYGAIYRTLSGKHKRIIVTRYGYGSNSFQPDGSGPKQAGVALEFVVEKTGERGAIYGPMRSHMFVTDLAVLKRLGYRWGKVAADPGGFYRVLSDDGDKEIFTFDYVGCARHR
jgi:hypothetical protein